MADVSYRTFHSLNEDIIRIRTEVFVIEQGFHNEFDETDRNCTHIVLFLDGKAAAVCRYFREGETYHIGRVAVSGQFRGRGLGRKIMLAAEQEIAREAAEKSGGGTVIMELSAQCRVSKFYERLGYVPYGEIFYDEYCPHIKMRKVRETQKKAFSAFQVRS